jgi:hypothetical protein
MPIAGPSIAISARTRSASSGGSPRGRATPTSSGRSGCRGLVADPKIPDLDDPVARRHALGLGLAARLDARDGAVGREADAERRALEGHGVVVELEVGRRLLLGARHHDGQRALRVVGDRVPNFRVVADPALADLGDDVALPDAPLLRLALGREARDRAVGRERDAERRRLERDLGSTRPSKGGGARPL